MKTRKWDLFWAKVKYEDIEDFKIRPVVVIGEEEVLISALKCTSKLNKKFSYFVKYWEKSGLCKPTAIKIDKIIKITKRNLERKIGRLDPEDIAEIKKLLNSNLKSNLINKNND
ncbi:MAG: type II toxin-antitoxin system PemK/MazF family toxin [Oscillospiraceae bacterium]|nr:type II toxin-antitoxin system PemK/MazF family toxin [Oscillospiraceae bacterium]